MQIKGKPFLDWLKESIDLGLSHSNIRDALADCLRDAFPNGYAYLLDVYGDDESGDVIYYANGDTYKASYELGQANGKRMHAIDTEHAVEVLPRTVYDEEAGEDDQVVGDGGDANDDVDEMDEAAREAAGWFERFPGSAKWARPLCERFISKDERDAADKSDFAGKGQSFPILKPSDVGAAVRSLGRAGTKNHSIATLKAHIIAIAKRKGWTKYLPKSWRAGGSDDGDAAQEAQRRATGATGGAEVDLVGDVVPLREGAVGQDGTVALKLIAPGWGSSGYYGKEVLKRDGPKFFTEGTKNFWDHATEQEEAERPEGSLRNLASVLTENAHYEDEGPAGPGLYARAKVFSEFRQPVDDLAKHIGMSIRASGIAKEGEAEGRRGKIVERFTRADSVDYVTTPGAGGKVLQLFEAARTRTAIQPEEASKMDKAELQAAIREALAPVLQEITVLKERNTIADAGNIVDGELAGYDVPTKLKAEIKRRVLEAAVIGGTPARTPEKLKEATKATAQELCSLIESVAPTGRPVNLGQSAASDADRAAGEKQFAEAYEGSMKDLSNIFCGDGKENKAMRKRFREGRAA
jgi:hypothetical protein